MDEKQKTCGEKCEVFTRPNGYYRPVSNFNDGKKAEVEDRKMIKPDCEKK